MHRQARHSVTESICKPAPQQGLGQAKPRQGGKEGVESQGVRKEGAARPDRGSLPTGKPCSSLNPARETFPPCQKKKKKAASRGSWPALPGPCRPGAATPPARRALPLSGAPPPGSRGGAGRRPAGGSSGARTNGRPGPRNGPNGRRGAASRLGLCPPRGPPAPAGHPAPPPGAAVSLGGGTTRRRPGAVRRGCALRRPGAEAAAQRQPSVRRGLWSPLALTPCPAPSLQTGPPEETPRSATTAQVPVLQHAATKTISVPFSLGGEGLSPGFPVTKVGRQH